jgi:hypothetical protein
MLKSVHAQCLIAFQLKDKGERPPHISPHVLQSALRLTGQRAARIELHMNEWSWLGAVQCMPVMQMHTHTTLRRLFRRLLTE